MTSLDYFFMPSIDTVERKVSDSGLNPLDFNWKLIGIPDFQIYILHNQSTKVGAVVMDYRMQEVRSYDGKGQLLDLMRQRK